MKNKEINSCLFTLLQGLIVVVFASNIFRNYWQISQRNNVIKYEEGKFQTETEFSSWISNFLPILSNIWPTIWQRSSLLRFVFLEPFIPYQLATPSLLFHKDSHKILQKPVNSPSSQCDGVFVFFSLFVSPFLRWTMKASTWNLLSLKVLCLSSKRKVGV